MPCNLNTGGPVAPEDQPAAENGDSSINPPWWAAILVVFMFACLAFGALQVESRGATGVHIAYAFIALCAGVATFTFGGKTSIVRSKASQLTGSAAVFFLTLVLLLRVATTDRSRFMIHVDGRPAPAGTTATLLSTENAAPIPTEKDSGQFWMNIPQKANPNALEFNIEVPRYKGKTSRAQWDSKLDRFDLKLDSSNMDAILAPVHVSPPKPVSAKRARFSDALAKPPTLHWTVTSDSRLRSAPPLELMLFRKSFDAINLLSDAPILMTATQSGLWTGELETGKLINNSDYPHGTYIFRVKSTDTSVESDFAFAFEDDFSDLSDSFRSRKGDFQSIYTTSDHAKLRIGPVTGKDFAWGLLSEDFAFPQGFVIRCSFDVPEQSGERPTSLHLGLGNRDTNLFSITLGDPGPQDIGLKYRKQTLEPHSSRLIRGFHFDGRRPESSVYIAAAVIPGADHDLLVRVFAAENDSITCVEDTDCESFVASWKTDPREFTLDSIFLRLEVWGPGTILLNALTVEEWRESSTTSGRSALAVPGN